MIRLFYFNQKQYPIQSGQTVSSFWSEYALGMRFKVRVRITNEVCVRGGMVIHDGNIGQAHCRPTLVRWVISVRHIVARPDGAR